MNESSNNIDIYINYIRNIPLDETKISPIWKDNKWIYKNRNYLIDNIIFAKYAILHNLPLISLITT